MAKKSNGAFSVDTVFLIVTRDDRRCAACGEQVHGERGRDWSVHHRKPRGMGGSKDPAVSSPANGVILCGSGTTGCHGEVEQRRENAMAEGFLISRNGVQVPSEVPIEHAVHGLVRLDDDGGFTLAESEQTWATFT